MSAPIAIRLEDDQIHAGERFRVSLQRTLRVPDDGRAYPLPPGFGRFPLRAAARYPSLPAEWRNDFFAPVYAREALWIAFDGATWKPNAAKVGTGGVNVVTGGAWDEELHGDPQDYVVVPDQLWLDGINSGAETVRQFVVMPHGGGYTIEQQITGGERVGGVQFVVFEPKPGRFPDEEPPREDSFGALMAFDLGGSMGVAVGGEIQQKIHPDAYGIDTWDPEQRASFRIYLLTPAEFAAITGEAAPSSPIDASEYTNAGFPWFALYEADEGDLTPAEALGRLKSIREIEERAAEKSIDVRKAQTIKLRKKKR